MKKPVVTRLDMASIILNWEARWDKDHHLRVYPLPKNDGGGSFEVAGLNERYDGPMARKLRSMINAGKFDEAVAVATEAIAKDTDVVMGWVKHQALQFFMRDCCFNRGAGGAAKMLQMALGVKADGGVGPITKGAVSKFNTQPLELLSKLRVSRESYEHVVVGDRANFAQGLKNRWDNCLTAAIQMV